VLIGAGPHTEPREPYMLETSRPGVFAAGDVRRGAVKRMASAVGEGAMAVRLVHEHLAHRDREAQGRPVVRGIALPA